MKIIKKLDLYILKNFLLLFAGTFFICLFIFMMQFLWKSINALVGKGLSWDVLAQFFFYASLTLVPMSLPLAVLLASLISFGNMGEKLELLSTAGERIFKDMLPLIDDFERARQAMQTTEDIQAVREGIDLIYQKFIGFLEKNDVKQIPTENADFDTEYHEAITTFPAPTAEQKGKVIDCTQKGYTLGEKVIRYAKVVVGE